MNQQPFGNFQSMGSAFDPTTHQQGQSSFLSPSPGLNPTTDNYASSPLKFPNGANNQQRSMSIDFTNFLNNDPVSSSSVAATVNSNSATSASNVGARTRHRSGTLPSKLNGNGSSNIPTSNTSSIDTPLLPPVLNPMSISPSLDAVFEDSSEISSHQQPQSRLRSASIQSSIWSDGLSSLNPQEISSPAFLSSIGNSTAMSALFSQQQIPQLSIDLESLLSNNTSSTTNPTTPPISSSNRIRSYSANNVLFPSGDKHHLNQYLPIKEELYQPQTEDFNRPRSQTHGSLSFADPNVQSQVSDMQFNPLIQLQQQNQTIPSHPLLQDNVPESAITITSSHTNPSLGPTNTLLIINLPTDQSLTNSMNFYRMLTQFGPILSIRIITCNENGDLVAIVEFNDVESAIRCKAKMNFQELVPNLSCVVSFAKILGFNDQSQQQQQQSMSSSLTQQQHSLLQSRSQPNSGIMYSLNQHGQYQSQFPGQSQEQQPVHNHQQSLGQQQQHRNSDVPIITTTDDSKDEQVNENIKLTTLSDKIDIFRPILNGVMEKDMLTKKEKLHLRLMVSKALEYTSIKETTLGKLPDPLTVRQFDTPRLRDIRKQIDANQLSKLDIEELSLAMHDELPELASDYLGNTIVQRLFEVCDIPIRDSMIKALSPFLAQMGAHKNGTWAAQKLINTIATEREKWMVSEALRPYCTQLFNDQYANYVIHGVLKFGQPWNDFIIETMISTFMEISRNRYGARAIRTCLESEYISKEALVGIAICVLTWCWELILDTNGSLLITWFLDTCQLIDDRHLILAQMLVRGQGKSVAQSNVNSVGSNSTVTSSNGSRSNSASSAADNHVSIADELNADGTTNQNGGSVSAEDQQDDTLNLIKICCSKLGNLSVLKVLNYRSSLAARDLILSEIFGYDLFTDEDISDDTQLLSTLEPLKKILTDRTSNGSTFVYKILSIPTIDADLKKKLSNKIKVVLQECNLVSNHQYKRLCEEVGLKVQHQRTLSVSSRKKKSRSRSNSTNTNNSNMGNLNNNGYSQMNNGMNVLGGMQQQQQQQPQQQQHSSSSGTPLQQSGSTPVSAVGAPHLNSNSFFAPLPLPQQQQNEQMMQSSPGLFNIPGLDGVNINLVNNINGSPLPQQQLNSSVNGTGLNPSVSNGNSGQSNNIDYDLLLRQQLEKMSLNNPNNYNNGFVTNNNGKSQQHQDQQLFY